MAEKNKLPTIEQLKLLALRTQADSAARIADLAALVAKGYGHIVTVTLPAANWSDKAQKIEHKSLLADSGYCYFVCGDAGIKADNVTKDGEITFRCEVTPDVDLTISILRLEVETDE